MPFRVSFPAFNPQSSNNMESKEQIDELMIWLEKLSAGKKLQSVSEGGAIWQVYDVDDLCRYLKAGDQVQIKQIEIPAPPDGEIWHNPDELTSEQIGIEDGWRLLLVSELNSLRENSLLPSQIWVSTCSKWSNGDVSGGNLCDTYRVKADEHPVGSLRPVTDLSREKIEAELADDLKKMVLRLVDDYDHCAVDKFILAIKSGNFKHLEIKYG